MFWRVRTFWAAAGISSYVSFAALSDGADQRLPWLALVALPIGLAVAWNITAPPSRGEDRIDAGARAAARACVTGAAIVIAARTGQGSAGFEAFAHLGVGIAMMAALVALGRLESLGGLMVPPPGARRLEPAALVALLWSIAIGIPAARVLLPERTHGLSSLVDDTAVVWAAVGSLVLLIARAAHVRATRRLELGVAERAGASLWLSSVALVLGVAAGAMNVLPASSLMPLAGLIAALVTTWSAVSLEATTVGRALRTSLALIALTSPIALGAIYLAQLFVARASAVFFGAAVLIAVAGLITPLVARRLAPAAERWLLAFDAATEAAMNPDPDQALEDALGHLRVQSGRAPAAIGRSAGRYATPSLYRIGPGDVMTVDRAGFVHIESAELPARILDLADVEPEGVLRGEVLRALEVRRPDLRPLEIWLDERSLAACAVIRDTTGPIGVLAIPRGTRTSPMILEEVRALRRLADRLGAVLGVAASLARSRQRETSAEREVDRARLDLRILKESFEQVGRRFRALAEVLSRPARTASYSPAARAVTEELARLAELAQPIAILTAPGVSPWPWAALYHLRSPLAAGPLVFVEGTDRAYHDVAAWRSAADSPLSLAAGGTLCLLDPQALPVPVQRYLGAALPREIGAVLVLPATVDTMVARDQLEERFADRIGDRSLMLPTLRSRGEDLRGLALDMLTHIGLRHRGEPIGIDLSALAVLGEHDWPGNDTELFGVLTKAALVAGGPTVTADDLAVSGFVPTSAPPKLAPAASGPTLPKPKRRRRPTEPRR